MWDLLTERDATDPCNLKDDIQMVFKVLMSSNCTLHSMYKWLAHWKKLKNYYPIVESR